MIFGKRILIALLVLLGIGARAGTAVAGDESIETVHKDWRKTPRIEVFTSIQEAPLDKNKSRSEAVAEFLAKSASRYGIAEKVGGLKPVREQRSLTGFHYTFEQRVAGTKVVALARDRHGNVVDVVDALAVVTVDLEGQRVKQVANNLYPVNESQAKTAETPDLIASAAARSRAWTWLRAGGDLLEEPTVEHRLLATAESFTHVYLVNLAVTEPFGYWEVGMDAKTGDPLWLRDRRHPKRGQESYDVGSPPAGPAADFDAAYAKFKQKTAAKVPAAGAKAAGTALAFDPDPRTTLGKPDLQDGSPAADFDPAYVTIALPDITLANGSHELRGPWAQIIDFEPPNTAPSTTANGKWTAKRGNNAFNDAMSYAFVDLSQRYIQSLGFTGSQGICAFSIEIDSDGLSGADNSHYLPWSRRLAFGHGCVDDNEDCDVILHEYGHAILHDAAKTSWTGGDTGAMGEGFGDYWAASFSITRTGGATYRPNEVFSWDGHGTGDLCWPGRVLDRMTALYDPSETYFAHDPMNGFVSDELWSTPLFQSLLALVKAGTKREEVDRIILNAHVGVDPAPTMRDMAVRIVDTAKLLHPGGPHAGVFTENFRRHNILPAAPPPGPAPTPMPGAPNGGSPLPSHLEPGAGQGGAGKALPTPTPPPKNVRYSWVAGLGGWIVWIDDGQGNATDIEFVRAQEEGARRAER